MPNIRIGQNLELRSRKRLFQSFFFSMKIYYFLLRLILWIGGMNTFIVSFKKSTGHLQFVGRHGPSSTLMFYTWWTTNELKFYFILFYSKKPYFLESVHCGFRWASKTPAVSGSYKRCTSWLELEICCTDFKPFTIRYAAWRLQIESVTNRGKFTNFKARRYTYTSLWIFSNGNFFQLLRETCEMGWKSAFTRLPGEKKQSFWKQNKNYYHGKEGVSII
jgi:hypothetical protein